MLPKIHFVYKTPPNSKHSAIIRPRHADKAENPSVGGHNRWWLAESLNKSVHFVQAAQCIHNK